MGLLQSHRVRTYARKLIVPRLIRIAQEVYKKREDFRKITSSQEKDPKCKWLRKVLTLVMNISDSKYNSGEWSVYTEFWIPLKHKQSFEREKYTIARARRSCLL